MPEYGELVPIPDHRTAVDHLELRWLCACGDSGRATPDHDVYETARKHRDDQVKEIVPTLAPAQIAAALRLGAHDSSIRAAVELLIRHEHWIGYGYLRNYLRGEWTDDGSMALRVDWLRTAAAAGHAQYLVDVLDARDAPYELVQGLRKWADGTGAPAKPIHGSTSTMAILRVACSIAGRFPVNIGSDLSNLDKTNRGLVITAIAHLLNHGGELPMRSALNWLEYDGR